MVKKKTKLILWVLGALFVGILGALMFVNEEYTNQECGTVTPLIGEKTFIECSIGNECVISETNPDFHCAVKGETIYYNLEENCEGKTVEKSHGRVFTSQAECLQVLEFGEQSVSFPTLTIIR